MTKNGLHSIEQLVRYYMVIEMKKKRIKELELKIEKLEVIITRIFRLNLDRDNYENDEVRMMEWSIWANNFSLDAR